jgi:hypothetical protein
MASVTVLDPALPHRVPGIVAAICRNRLRHTHFRTHDIAARTRIGRDLCPACELAE